ncbi:hypothetical protein OP10G_2217 [Fimbriimonas ginsengisoli Gsoil 348]|uniref:Cytochrome c domain-containing protein n=1 Tax=Fimbriimonas ginsengisoli Gsoil 348 TaxID=661478 RepID=A0A068NS70_FIMGI|nr:hypothetical protein OP10G_2217 [Fimbriimonas ginsengisoli Gsoil 348]
MLFALGACGGGGGSSSSGTPPPDPGATLGDPLPGLTADQSTRFQTGQHDFIEAETEAQGVGPLFNGTACAECHKAGTIGGAGTDLDRTRVTRIGGVRAGAYSDLESMGGPVMQSRSLREFDPSYPCVPETVPSGAEYVSHRMATPLFGLGLVEAIPDATILAGAVAKADGVQGVANMVRNPDTGRTELGRFGWKAQVSTLHWFAGDAYLNEMGVTSPSFPKELLPQGQPIPPGADTVADPEDNGRDVGRFTDFMRFLAPPVPSALSAQAVRGKQLFAQIACTACHTPSMQTGPNEIAALANRPVPLYSDLLLHRMGSLGDNIVQGQAAGDQFRTAPLWGLQHRHFFLHDGRATTLEQAISDHDGEATAARTRFFGLADNDRAALLEFLGSL